MDVDLQFGRRFRFECFWPKADGFMDVVDTTWLAVPSEGNPFVALHNKLKATTKVLVKWSARWIGNTKFQILVAIEVIYRLDIAIESRDLSIEEIALEKTLKRNLLGLSSLEGTIARRRSGLSWLKEGDANTRFFHQHATH